MAVLLRPFKSAQRPRVVQARVRVADAVVMTLAELGVDTYYGIPGGGIASVYDALLDQQGARIINTRHETGAVFAAMGHSRVGGSLPCVLMTSGPGVTNALTGLAAAQADSVPLIAIGGEVPRKNFGRGALQEGSRYQLDVLGMVQSVTKLSAEIAMPRSAATIVRKAVEAARSGRPGPVFLSLPLDVANERVAMTRTTTSVATALELDEDTLDAAAEVLQASERGVIVVGSGARHPETVRWIGTLAATLQLPVITTPKAKGVFPESDPLSLGVFGLGGHPSASDYLQGGIDTVLCIGCGLGETGTNSWSPLLQASNFIQLDIDPAQIGKNYQVDYGLVGPAHLVLRQLMSRLRRRPEPAKGVTGVKHHPVTEVLQPDAALRHDQALLSLQKAMPPDAIFTSDIGEHAIFAIHYLRTDQPDAFLVAAGLGSMGSGIGAAIGAKLAQPARPVVAICGDAGFQMHGMELATCMHYGIGVVFAIFNDARMRMVEHGQATVFGRSGEMDTPLVDFAALARSMGAEGYSIRTRQDFDRLGKDVANRSVPVVLDIHIDPASCFPVNGRVTQIRNFAAE